MKNIFISFIVLICTILLYGCGETAKKKGTTVATTPAHTIASATTVRLKAQNKGNVSHIDFSVVLPSGTKTSLLDYNGSATMKGTIQTVPALPCLAKSLSFSCNAQVSVGNITASNCSIGGNSTYLMIVLTRSSTLKQNTYDVKSIIINVDQSCYFKK